MSLANASLPAICSAMWPPMENPKTNTFAPPPAARGWPTQLLMTASMAAAEAAMPVTRGGISKPALLWHAQFGWAPSVSSSQLGLSSLRSCHTRVCGVPVECQGDRGAEAKRACQCNMFAITHAPLRRVPECTCRSSVRRGRRANASGLTAALELRGTLARRRRSESAAAAAKAGEQA